MATRAQQIVNTSNKQTIEFITTAKASGGALLEMISTWYANSPKPRAHYHPVQKEFFIILEGELTVTLNDKTTVFKQNETFEIEKGNVHAMWNASDKIAKALWKVQPALNTENLLKSGARLSEIKNPITKIFKTLLLLIKYRKEFRIGKARTHP
jgi:quercetin dioxygenase-like cupin family protein